MDYNKIILCLKNQINKFNELETNQKYYSYFIIFFGLMFYGVFENFIFYLLCFFIPSISTFEELLNHNKNCINENKEDDININNHLNTLSKWSVYWIIYSWINFIENFFPTSLIPYYTLLKIIFLIIGFKPKNNFMDAFLGRYDIYDKFMIFIKNQIDKTRNFLCKYISLNNDKTD